MRIFQPTITGSLNITGGILLGTASYATTASYALNGGGGSGAGFPYSGSAVISGSLLVSGSGITVTGSITSTLSATGYATQLNGAEINIIEKASGKTISIVPQYTPSFNTTLFWPIDAGGAFIPLYVNNNTADLYGNIAISSIPTASYLMSGTYSVTSSWATNAKTASFLPVGTYQVTSSWATNAITASFLPVGTYQVTSSWATNAITASFLPVGTYQVTSSWATNAITASYANNFTVANTLTVQTIVAQTITSSIDYVTGSSRFGSLLSNTHQFTGSVSMTGSLNVVGAGITGSLLGTSSWANNATTASYVTGSIHSSTNPALSSSYALTASYAMNAGGGGSTFPYTGTAVISGSLTVSKGNTDYVNSGGANSHILLNNTSSIGQTSITSIINGNLAGKWRSDYIGGNSYVSSGSQGYHAFWTNGDSGTGSIRLYISSSGNIGIGTQSPAYKLDVSGSGNFSGNLTVTSTITANKYVFTDGVINTNQSGQNMFAVGGNYMYLYTGVNGLYINNQANSANNVVISDAGNLQTRGTITAGSPGNDQSIYFGGTNAGLYWAGSGASIVYSAGALNFSSVGSSNNMVLQNGGGATFNYGITGSLQGTSSYATTASYALNGGGSAAFLKSRTAANATSSVIDYDSIFNPSNLLVQDTSVFYVDSTSYYYVLGDLINSGSIVVDGTLKIGGTLYNVGTITGTGSII